MPRLPASGWKVHYQEALASWLLSNPSLADVQPCVAWIERCKASGPPEHGMEFDGDWHLALVPGTRVVVTYLVIKFEYLIIVKDFA